MVNKQMTQKDINVKISKESLLTMREIILTLINEHSHFLTMLQDKHDISDSTLEYAMNEANEALA